MPTRTGDRSSTTTLTASRWCGSTVCSSAWGSSRGTTTSRQSRILRCRRTRSIARTRTTCLFGGSRMSALNVQEGGDHYKLFATQPSGFFEPNRLGFADGNVFKYVCRHETKGGADDLRKAIHYLELLLELRYGEKRRSRSSDGSGCRSSRMGRGSFALST